MLFISELQPVPEPGGPVNTSLCCSSVQMGQINPSVGLHVVSLDGSSVTTELKPPESFRKRYERETEPVQNRLTGTAVFTSVAVFIVAGEDGGLRSVCLLFKVNFLSGTQTQVTNIVCGF